MADKITCQICGDLIHAVQLHLKEAHPDWAIERYKTTYPDAELLSERAKEKLRARMTASAGKVAAAGGGATVVSLSSRTGARRPMHELFGFGEVKAAMNARGEPVMVTVLGQSEHDELVPDVDENYVFGIELTKTVIMGMEFNMSVLLWGYHGTGKTSQFEQVCARTRRPFIRVQHTVNTEESHVLGQMLVRDGSTYFEPGPLALAMKHGWVYCADEYDFAMPSVLSVYQPVLEGKPLVIKEAPSEWRIVRPHSNFRFVATGNTNGGGDETGLYQGTQIQNAANYSRFGIVEEVTYMAPKIEAAVVAGQSGVDLRDVEKLIEFAGEVRKNFVAGRIGSTISPRELINAAKIGLLRGANWKLGLKQGFSNRLSRVDKEVVEQFAQRIFG